MSDATGSIGIDSAAVVIVVLILGIAYAAAHGIAERSRVAALRRREVWPIEKVTEDLHPQDQLAARLAACVLAGVAAALRIEPGQVRTTDHFDREYRLRWSGFLFDETDEAIRVMVRDELARVGFPGWRPQTWPATVGDLVLEVHGFARDAACAARSRPEVP